MVPPVEEMTTEYVEAVVNAIEAESGKLFARVLAESEEARELTLPAVAILHLMCFHVIT